MNAFIRCIALSLFVVVFFTACRGDTKQSKLVHQVDEGTYIVSVDDGRRLKIRAYGENIIRLQSVRAEEDFYADDHYEMVMAHDWPRTFDFSVHGDHYRFTTGSDLSLRVDKSSLASSFYADGKPVLSERSGVQWQGNTITASFNYENEHFTGLGHGFYARENSLDLRGKVVARNYGQEQREQAPLIVPFYLSSNGYGVFLNSTFTNKFTFGVDGEYSIAIDDLGFGGRMDYFFINGPEFKTILDRYTQLTGRPRLPPKSMFGLQLSDKGHDHASATPSDQTWWQQKITEHREAGFPLDHVVNDNRWRAAGGKRCESKLAWDSERYPDPAAYNEWLNENGLTATVDFNRCIAKYTDGWKPEFNLPETGKIDFADSAPDLTHAGFRDWFWQAFYDNTLNPELGYPGSALWIDEFDEQGGAPMDMILANGRSSAEMRNYWFFLIAKALVQEGWDKSDINKRPFVWVRGMTAGGQRYATLWSGDIYPHYEDMRGQVRAMQLAGMSGFPYWGHDAGGFYNWEEGKGPDDKLYVQWGMALGSVSPIWKPHGVGQSRWPLDRAPWVQEQAHKYMDLRYQLMPYLYSMAHIAANTGTPIVRPMVLEFQQHEQAWQYDLQFMLGDSLLVAPNTSGEATMDVWLPAGNWYDYDSKQLVKGNRVISVEAPLGKLPMYVKEGAVIPRRDPALSTAFINKEKLIFDVYTGGSSSRMEVIEDDEITDAYREGEFAVTTASYDNEKGELKIQTTREHADYVPAKREFEINFYGTANFSCVEIDGEKVASEDISTGTKVILSARSTAEPVVLKVCGE